MLRNVTQKLIESYDGFGIGTEMPVSTDVPDLDFANENLVAYDGEPRMKLSSSKVMMPGRARC